MSQDTLTKGGTAVAKGFPSLRPTEDQLRRGPALAARVAEGLARFLGKGGVPRPRTRKAVAADKLWWYWMECYKRSPRRARLIEIMRAKGEDSRLKALSLLREEIGTAPFFPIATDGATWVTVKLDLRYPLRLVLPLVEENLRDFSNDPTLLHDFRDSHLAEEILRSLSQKPPAPPWTPLTRLRVHVKDLKLRLRVWDRLTKGATFKALAKQLGKPLSTVRDLYTKAALDICGALPPRGRRPRLLVAFNPDTHLTTCPTCSKAPRVEDFCPAGRAYANQDYVALRELPVAEPRAR